MDPDEPTSLELTRAEALVLFDFLHRLEDQKVHISADPAEQVAVWALSASLERALVDPFQADYDGLIAQARHHLTASQ